jgi:hypothetical protein
MKLRRMAGKVLNILFASTDQTDKWVQSEQQLPATVAHIHIGSVLRDSNIDITF